MSIVFDLIPTQYSGAVKFHGGGEYAKVVFKHLVKNKKDTEIVCLYKKGFPLDDDIAGLIQDYHRESIGVESIRSVETVLAAARVNKFYSWETAFSSM